MLSDAGLLSRCDKREGRRGIFGGFEGFFHWPPECVDSTAANLIPDQDYPKIGSD